MATQTTRRPAPAAAPDSRPLHTPSASVGTLRTARRRISLARIGVWAALAAGPVALAVACAMPRTVVTGAQSPTTAPSTLRTADPAGVASLFCELWLRSDAMAADSSTAQAVHELAPNVDLPRRSGTTAVTRTVAVHSAQLGDGSWSVVVAAQFTVRDETSESAKASDLLTIVKYFAVPVVAADSASGAGAFTVTAAPAQIAGPGTAKAPSSPFEDALPGDSALMSSLGEFFNAYLVGVGEVDRYLSPGAKLTAVPGSGYTSVVVDRAAADSEVASGAVPQDGTVVRVQAHISATDTEDGRWPLVYTLTLTARSGRWEVTALQAGAETKTATAKASPKPTASTTVGGAAQ